MLIYARDATGLCHSEWVNMGLLSPRRNFYPRPLPER